MAAYLSSDFTVCILQLAGNVMIKCLFWRKKLIFWIPSCLWEKVSFNTLLNENMPWKESFKTAEMSYFNIFKAKTFTINWKGLLISNCKQSYTKKR